MSITQHPVAKIDESSGSIVTIGTRHHYLHEGYHFVLSRPVTLPVAADDEILIVTPDSDTETHINFSVVSDAVVTLSIYESTTLTGGTALTPYNRDRNSGTGSTLIITHTPSGSGDGTLIFSWKAGANTPVGGGAEGNEINILILKRNAKYLLRASGSNGDNITTILDWYERIH